MSYNELVSTRVGMLSCKNYCKWYDLYYVMTSDEFSEYKLNHPSYVGNEIIPLSEYIPESSLEIDYYDHSWKPKSIVEFAINHNIKIGTESYKAMVNMYFENFWEDISKDLPLLEDLEKVLVNDGGDYSDCSFEVYDDSDPDHNLIPYDTLPEFKYCIPDDRTIFTRYDN